MAVRRIINGLLTGSARRPVGVLLAALLVLAVAVALVTRLEPDTGASTLLGSSSPSHAATERSQELFGTDAVLIRISGPVARLVLTEDLERVLGLEGCLAGRQPGAGEGPCARLAALRPAQVVIGPGTFINTSATQISDEYERRMARARRDARSASTAAIKLARARGWSEERAQAAGAAAAGAVLERAGLELLQIGVRFGILRPPTINDQNFVSRLVFASGEKAGTPKARFAYLFPSRDTSLISVRLRAGLTEAEREQAIEDIRGAVAMERWRLRNGGRYAVTGAPVVLSDMTAEVTGALRTLTVVALLVMAAALALVFPARRRLVPLVVALAATAVTFGLLAAVGASLTIAAVAVAPILLGLAVDYSLQLQARLREEGGERELTAATALVSGAGAPTIVVAALTTAAGFSAMALSPVPMVRGFGLLLVVGVLVGVFAALTLTPALLALPGRLWRSAAAAARPLAASLRGAGLLLRENRPVRAVAGLGGRIQRAALEVAERRPRRVLVIGAVLALAGIAVDGLLPVESDVTRLAPQSLESLRELRGLQRSTGVGGQLDVLVEARRVSDPAVVRWMTRYQQRVLDRFGYGERRGCGRADICPAFSLPDLFDRYEKPTKAQIDSLLKAIPPAFSQSVITADRRAATVAFGIRLMSLDRQAEVIDVLRAELDPPHGVKATLVGLPVLAADANARVASPLRRLSTMLAGLLAVALALRLLLGRWRRAFVPLVPIVMAAGWAPLVLAVIGVPLNPMSVVLGALVIAIATEFSVLLSERLRRERERSPSIGAALRATYRSTGGAVLASATTAIAGFAVLIVSDIRMLRDFGIVTVVDLAVAVAAVMLVLPSALAVFSDRDGGRR